MKLMIVELQLISIKFLSIKMILIEVSRKKNKGVVYFNMFGDVEFYYLVQLFSCYYYRG